METYSSYANKYFFKFIKNRILFICTWYVTIQFCFFLYLPAFSHFSIRNIHFLCNKNANKIIYIFQISSRNDILDPKCQDLMPFPFKHYQISAVLFLCSLCIVSVQWMVVEMNRFFSLTGATKLAQSKLYELSVSQPTTYYNCLLKQTRIKIPDI